MRATGHPVHPTNSGKFSSPLPPSGSWASVASSAPAALARGLGIMTALAGRSPAALIPEQPLIAPVRGHVVDHDRELQAPLGATPRAQRIARKVGRPRPPPPHTVAARRRARALPVQRLLDVRRAPHPRWAMHRRLRGHWELRTTKPRRGGRAADPSPQLDPIASATHAMPRVASVTSEPHVRRAARTWRDTCGGSQAGSHPASTRKPRNSAAFRPPGATGGATCEPRIAPCR
jgi:hypothetical protein